MRAPRRDTAANVRPRGILFSDPGGRTRPARLGGSLRLTEDVLDLNLPAGENTRILFNDNGALAGAAAFTYDKTTPAINASAPIRSTFAGNWLENRPANYLTQNGPFAIQVGRALNPIDGRHDDVAAIGWNIGGVIPGLGAVQLTFESHCSDGTGCGTPQSEIFFVMVGPDNVRTVRPLGFFQADDGVENVTVIARAFSWTFWNQAQTQALFDISENGALTMMHAAGTFTAPSSISWLFQNGTAILGWDTGGGRPWFSPAASCVIGSDADNRHIYLKAVHLRTEASAILNGAGTKTRVAFGNGGDDFWTFSSGDAIPLEQTPTGTAANISVVFRSKGTGDFTLQPGDVQGFLWLRTGKMQFGRGSIPFSGNDDIVFCNNAGGSQTKVYVTAGQAQVSDLQQWTDNGFGVLARVEASGVFRASGYKSADGSAGVTTTFEPGSTVTVKNGLITAVEFPVRVIGFPHVDSPEPDYMDFSLADFMTSIL